MPSPVHSGLPIASPACAPIVSQCPDLKYMDQLVATESRTIPRLQTGSKTMSITFWGTRGSIASQGPDTVRYGGNTSCVEVQLDNGSSIIFDAGTGLRPLGNALLARSKAVSAYLFISHMHWDHIQGLPFFTPAYLPTTELTILGPAAGDQSLRDLLSGQMRSPYFPITLDAMAAHLSFVTLDDSSCFPVPGAIVEASWLNHPGPTLGYRLSANGRVLVYATDNEPFDEQTRAQHRSAPTHLPQFAQNADVLIMDAQYIPEEYPQRVGWGHSTYMDALQLAQAANVKHLVLFHHDPNRTDYQLDTIVAICNAWSVKQGCRFTCTAATEGCQLDL